MRLDVGCEDHMGVIDSAQTSIEPNSSVKTFALVENEDG
jgi:hypothetical protein